MYVTVLESQLSKSPVRMIGILKGGGRASKGHGAKITERRATKKLQGGGGDDEVCGGKESSTQDAGPDNETSLPGLEGASAIRPFIWRVDRGITIDVGAVLALELVDTATLALGSLGIYKSFLLHLCTNSIIGGSLLLRPVFFLLHDVAASGGVHRGLCGEPGL